MGFFDLFKKKKEEQVKTTPKTTQTPPKPKTPPKPECEHGKCVKCKHTFGQVEELYFTCDEAIKCAKKHFEALGKDVVFMAPENNPNEFIKKTNSSSK